MEFEFYRAKSVSNKKKHGIDFADAQLLWEDPDRLKVLAKTEDEQRVGDRKNSTETLDGHPHV